MQSRGGEEMSPEADRSGEQWIRDVVERATGMPAAQVSVRRLPGHASVRAYWRARWNGSGGAQGAVIVMVLPPDAPSDEISKQGPTGAAPFASVQRYLAGIGVRVPEVLAWSQEEGYAVLEDLGDDMMVTLLAAGAPRGPLYRTAIDQLAWMRVRAGAAPDPGCVAFGRRYDHDLYRWELEHFTEWVLRAWKQARLTGAEQALVDEAFDAITRILVGQPEGFTHRDYQSRNLMVLPDGSQAVIDFQDALLGPRAYDLVSLLRDSYVVLDAPFIVEMVSYYLARTAALGGPVLDGREFRSVFDLLTIQRKLKDAGRFIYLERVKGNRDFLRFVPVALGYAGEAFARLPEFEEVHRVLARHVPELT